MKLTIHFNLNGKDVSIQTEPNRRLIDVLREDFGLTGTKEGCGIGECGACTVLIDGVPNYSCSVLTHNVKDKAVISYRLKCSESGNGLSHYIMYGDLPEEDQP